MNENAQTQTPTTRQRPRWARAIHNFGDDLRWAVSAWCDFPRPARRVFTATVTAVAAHTVGVGDAVATIVAAITR